MFRVVVLIGVPEVDQPIPDVLAELGAGQQLSKVLDTLDAVAGGIRFFLEFIVPILTNVIQGITGIDISVLTGK